MLSHSTQYQDLSAFLFNFLSGCGDVSLTNHFYPITMATAIIRAIFGQSPANSFNFESLKFVIQLHSKLYNATYLAIKYLQWN